MCANWYSGLPQKQLFEGSTPSIFKSSYDEMVSYLIASQVFSVQIRITAKQSLSSKVERGSYKADMKVQFFQGLNALMAEWSKALVCFLLLCFVMMLKDKVCGDNQMAKMTICKIVCMSSILIRH